MLTFTQAEAMIAVSKGTTRRLGNNTTLVRLGRDTYAVRSHRTDVVTIHRDGRYTLKTGGWQTPTTKDRINTYGPVQVRIYQKQRQWCWGDGVPFVSGMTYDGTRKQVV